MSPLVSTEELARRSDWRVFDCRHDLAKPDWGAQEYAKAHIPGASFAHLDRDLSAPKTGRNGRHPLPEPAVFAAWLGNRGVKPGHPIVCYDAGDGVFAARLWWMLRWMGHEAVAVLDGGLARWLAEGRPVTSDAPQFPRTEYPAALRGELSVDAAFVESQRDRILLLDARSAVRFRGDKEPIDPVAGRIPGAINRFCMDNLTSEGRFKDAGELRAEYSALLGKRPPQDVVHYCGSGVAACHNVLAMEIAGFPGSRLYAGSWSEWISDPRRPLEKG